MYQGTVSFVDTGSHILTACHVLAAYKPDAGAHADLFCQLGAAAFDPIASELAADSDLDLATFDLNAETTPPLLVLATLGATRMRPRRSSAGWSGGPSSPRGGPRWPRRGSAQSPPG